MDENKKKKERASVAKLRKPSKRGETSQKMMSFRVDNDILEHLQFESNKGRLINELLRKHYRM